MGDFVTKIESRLVWACFVQFFSSLFHHLSSPLLSQTASGRHLSKTVSSPNQHHFNTLAVISSPADFCRARPKYKKVALQRHLCYNQPNNRLFTGFSEDAALDYQMLNSVWELKLKYERETRRLEDLRFFAHPSAPPLDGMPHAPAQSSKVEKLATLIVDAERSLTTIAEQIEAQKFKLLSLLNQSHMKELSQRVLNYHYVGCQSFNAIAKILSYSRRQVIRFHDEGLKFLGLDVHAMINFKKSLRVIKLPNNAQSCHIAGMSAID